MAYTPEEAAREQTLRTVEAAPDRVRRGLSAIRQQEHEALKVEVAELKTNVAELAQRVTALEKKPK